MQIPILVEPIDGGRFRARTGAPFDIVVEGETRLEAVRGVEDALRERQRNGTELYWSEVSETPSVGKYAGMLLDDDLTKRYLEAVDEYRKKCDEGTLFQCKTPGPSQNLSDLAGMHDPNDPFIQEWKAAVEEYRRQVDEGPDFPWLEPTTTARVL